MHLHHCVVPDGVGRRAHYSVFQRGTNRMDVSSVKYEMKGAFELMNERWRQNPINTYSRSHTLGTFCGLAERFIDRCHLSPQDRSD